MKAAYDLLGAAGCRRQPRGGITKLQGKREVRHEESWSSVVRGASEADGAALQRIDVATCTYGVVSPAPTPTSDGSFFGSRTVVDDVLVAEADGAVAGYVKLRLVHRLESSKHVLEVTGLAVAPDYQRSSIGRQLLDAAIGAARRRGARRLTLHVLGDNLPARALYERCGFYVEGILRDQFAFNGRYVDDVLMAYDLTNTAGSVSP